jgi:hypothetical protein
MSSEIKKGVACAIQALDGTRARRSLISRLTDLTHGRSISRSIERLDLVRSRLALTGLVSG